MHLSWLHPGFAFWHIGKWLRVIDARLLETMHKNLPNHCNPERPPFFTSWVVFFWHIGILLKVLNERLVRTLDRKLCKPPAMNSVGGFFRHIGIPLKAIAAKLQNTHLLVTLNLSRTTCADSPGGFLLVYRIRDCAKPCGLSECSAGVNATSSEPTTAIAHQPEYTSWFTVNVFISQLATPRFLHPHLTRIF